MIEIAYLKEKEKIHSLPQEVQEAIIEILQILDLGYGEERDKYNDDGGYVLVVESEDDLLIIKEELYIDYDDIIAEYINTIVCGNGEVYTNVLMICSDNYAISLIMPMRLMPKNLIDQMEE
ncbi:hypothetical protein [Alkalibaculum bacchi]|uniref:hypothetical protein n=1 Tax=Alkalibaculum bacchi TaxID=645887 RepID=UPI0026EBBA3E|nr:hypothetical protein [Alkalibaculum bacchi]